MTDIALKAFSPTGVPIVGLVDIMPETTGKSPCTFQGRKSDGWLEFDAGDSDISGVAGDIETKRDAREVAVFVDANGTEWPEDAIHLEGEEPRPIPSVAPASDALTSRELATVLAALRHWQRHQADSVGISRNIIAEDDIATCGGTLEPMRAAEIDGLCDRLNLGPAAPAAPPGDWYTVARDLAGALDSCTHQISQMSGMFGDEDGTIAEAMEGADLATEAYRQARANPPAAPALPPLAVIIEGGQVQGVVSNHPDLIGRDITIVDYDTDGAEEVVKVPQGGDSKPVSARVWGETVESAVFDIAAVRALDPEPVF